MKVVNINNAEYTVYIGRAGKGQDGTWGNPIKMGYECILCKEIHTERGEILPCYEIYLRNKLQTSEIFKQRFLELGEFDVLGCFCKPHACHGDIMVKVWNEYVKKV